MSNLKIVIDIRPLMHGETSGVEVYLKNLLIELNELQNVEKKQFKADLFFYYNSFHPVKFPAELDFMEKHKIWTRAPNKLLNLWWRFFKWPKLDRWIEWKIGIKPDVFFLPDPRLAPVSNRVKKVTTFHDLSFERFPANFSWRTRLWHWLLKPRREAESSNKIIAVSAFTKRELMDYYGISGEKIEVIQHGVDQKLSQLENKEKLQAVKKKYNLPEKYFLFVSSLAPRKNLINLIEAFKIFREKEGATDYKLVIAGKKNRRIFRDLRLELPDFVQWIGFFPEGDKRALYQSSVGLIYISLYEGFGLPVLEAFAAGIPVVASRIGALEEIMPKEGILVDPNQPEDIACGMEILLNQGNVQKILDAQKAIVSKFSWEKCARKTYEEFIL